MIPSAVLTLWDLTGSGARTVLPCLYSPKGRWFLAGWESWRQEIEIQSRGIGFWVEEGGKILV